MAMRVRTVKAFDGRKCLRIDVPKPDIAEFLYALERAQDEHPRRIIADLLAKAEQHQLVQYSVAAAATGGDPYP